MAMHRPRRFLTACMIAGVFCANFSAFSQDEASSALPAVDNVASAISYLQLQRSIENGLRTSYRIRYQELRLRESLIEDDWRAAVADLEGLLQSKLTSRTQYAVETQAERVSEIYTLRTAASSDVNSIMGQIIAQRNRILQLDSAIRSLKESTSRLGTDVTGTWSATLMPRKLQGEILLFQNGVMVNGRYHFSGGWEGSLSGYVAGKRLLLERYDAAMGRSGQFIVVLSEDGQTLTGSWSNYDLSIGPSSGAFTAHRVD